MNQPLITVVHSFRALYPPFLGPKSHDTVGGGGLFVTTNTKAIPVRTETTKMFNSVDFLLHMTVKRLFWPFEEVQMLIRAP